MLNRIQKLKELRNKGLSLIDVVVAMVVVSTILLGFFGYIDSIMKVSATNANYTDVHNEALNIAESLNAELFFGENWVVLHYQKDGYSIYNNDDTYEFIKNDDFERKVTHIKGTGKFIINVTKDGITDEIYVWKNYE